MFFHSAQRLLLSTRFYLSTAALLLLCAGLLRLAWPSAASTPAKLNPAFANPAAAIAVQNEGPPSSQFLAASASTRVQVPESMRAWPFDTDRYLNVPANFSASVYARISGARFIAVAPNGDLLVSQPGSGKVLLVRSNGTDDPTVYDYATNLRRPHDIVFHVIDGITYVYIAETHQINRFVYNSGDTAAHTREVLVSNLPDSSAGELRGAYGHELKNIALDSAHRLYISIASACNACTEDTVSDPVRGSIYVYEPDGSNGRLLAQGLRNAEGLAFVPDTNDLWATVNNRDQIRYPFDDGTGQYGQIIADYVDNHPPEEFTQVRSGGNYGWPFCNPNPDTESGMNNMPFDRDYEYNREGGVDCGGMDRINKGIQAHSAPLGLTFLQNTLFPEAYRNGAAIALHGSWNRQVPTGYSIFYFPWQNSAAGEGVDLVSGWLNAGTQEVWGRPVDVAVDLTGNMLISDDYSGTIYKLTYTAPPPAEPVPAVISFTLINADTDQPVAGYDPLPEGARLNLAELGIRNMNIRVNTDPGMVGSVRLAYDGDENYKVENYAPYTIAGDGAGGADYWPWTPGIGTHTLSATAYTAALARGNSGTARTVTFTVEDTTGQ